MFSSSYYFWSRTLTKSPSILTSTIQIEFCIFGQIIACLLVYSSWYSSYYIRVAAIIGLMGTVVCDSYLLLIIETAMNCIRGGSCSSTNYSLLENEVNILCTSLILEFVLVYLCALFSPSFGFLRNRLVYKYQIG